MTPLDWLHLLMDLGGDCISNYDWEGVYASSLSQLEYVIQNHCFKSMSPFVLALAAFLNSLEWGQEQQHQDQQDDCKTQCELNVDCSSSDDVTLSTHIKQIVMEWRLRGMPSSTSGSCCEDEKDLRIVQLAMKNFMIGRELELEKKTVGIIV